MQTRVKFAALNREGDRDWKLSRAVRNYLPHQSYRHWVTDEVSDFSVREMHFRCKQNFWISMTTVLEVIVPKDFGAICLYALYDIETQRRPNNSRWVQCVGKTEIISCFQRFLHFSWRANFWLLFELDTFASTYSRNLLPHHGCWSLAPMCLTLGAQMDFVTEAMLCKVFRPGDGKPRERLCHAESSATAILLFICLSREYV